MKVPLLDLTRQHASVGDVIERAVARVVQDQRFILGPEVGAFENEIAEWIGVPHAVAVASGTDALLLGLRALELQSGDEVVLPAFTFFATAGAVWNAGLRPVFCDVDPVTFNVTAETLEASWTERTRAVIPVHLFGQMAPMAEIVAFCERRGVALLEDAAQAIGARQYSVGAHRTAGAVGHLGAFSFFPTKNLGGWGDGGLVTTKDPKLAERVAKARVHGGRQMYHHEFVGTNSRLDALQAAVLRAKLPHLESWLVTRRENARQYVELLSGVADIRVPVTLEGNVHTYNQFTIRVARRDELRAWLADRGIGTGVYYPVPLHLQPCFTELGYREGQLPVSEQLCREVLSLPVFPELAESELRYVSEAIHSFYST